MATIGFVGAGAVGAAVARLAVAAGYTAVLTNSRGSHTLEALVAELGPASSSGGVEFAAEVGEIVVLSIPLRAVRLLPAGLLDGKVVLDASNYWPARDGRIEELEGGGVTSELVSRWLPGARLVKAFSTMLDVHVPQLARRAGAPDRTAIPIAADDVEAKAQAAAFIDEIGFDAVDAGTLADSWRMEPPAPAFVAPYGDATAARPASFDAVRRVLAEARQNPNHPGQQ